MILVKEVKIQTIIIPSRAATGRTIVTFPKSEISLMVPTCDRISSDNVAARNAAVSRYTCNSKMSPAKVRWKGVGVGG